MTHEQYIRLKASEPVYLRFMQIQEIDGSHITRIRVAEMHEVYKEMFRRTVDMHCSSCVVGMLKSLYNNDSYKAFNVKKSKKQKA